ncbi:MAG: hypothetical protein AAGG09_08845 [Pseudomonadota bacterium]
MRILITLAAAAAIMAGLVIGIAMAGAMLTRTAQAAAAQTGPNFTSGTLSKVAFVVLWCLVAGTAAGLIGGG